MVLLLLLTAGGGGGGVGILRKAHDSVDVVGVLAPGDLLIRHERGVDLVPTPDSREVHASRVDHRQRTTAPHDSAVERRLARVGRQRTTQVPLTVGVGADPHECAVAISARRATDVAAPAAVLPIARVLRDACSEARDRLAPPMAYKVVRQLRTLLRHKLNVRGLFAPARQPLPIRGR